MTHNQFLHILFENEIRWRSPGGRRNHIGYTGSGVDEADAVARWMVHILANQISHYDTRGLMRGMLGFNLRLSHVRHHWDTLESNPYEDLDFVLEGASLSSGKWITVRVARVSLNDPNAPKLYDYFGSSGAQGYGAGGVHDTETHDRYFIRTHHEEPVTTPRRP